MADTTALKNRIRAAIKDNNNQEITGPVLQQVLLDMVDELNGATETEADARQSGDTTLQQGITAEKNRAEGAESTLEGAINQEGVLRSNADATLQGNINAEATARENADTTLQAAINLINSYIPAQVSSSNQLADKDFVNSSITTATATFRGTYNVVSDLSLSYNATHAQIQTALATKMSALSITPDNNDYAFVQIPTADATPTQIAKIEKYKYNGTAWAFEYELNNSGFTASQWAAINSGATLELIGKLSALPTNAQLTEMLNGKVSLTDNGAYDVTAHNSGATFASLSAILNSENLDTLIPTDIRKGGMSIKFVQNSVQSSDKYVQYFLTKNEWSASEDDWVEGGGSGDGAYDISANNNNATYDNLTAALGTNGANIPQNMHKGGLSVKFLKNIYALYDVVKTDYGTTPSSDEQTIINSATDIEAPLPISDGSYNATEITSNYSGADKSTIDSTIDGLLLVGSVTYHTVVVVDGENHDIVWSITKVTDDTSKYVKYTLVTDDWSNNVNDWANDSVICDDDKVVKNRPLLNKYLVKGVDFEQFDGAYINAQGVITQESSNSYIKIPISKFRGNFVYLTGISLNINGYAIGYGVYDAEDNNLGGYYYGYPEGNNYKINKSTNASASYMLLSVGRTERFNGLVVFGITSHPTEQYDVQSINASQIIASQIDGVSNNALSWLKDNLAIERLNQFDKSKILDGVAVLDWARETKIDGATGSKMYFCEVPKDAEVITVRNIRGKTDYAYQGIVIVDENLTVLQKAYKFNSNLFSVSLIPNPYAGKRYFAFNVAGTEVGQDVSIDNIILYFKAQPQYAERDTSYYNIERVNKPTLNLNPIDVKPHNYLEDGVIEGENKSIIEIDVPVNGGDYVTYFLPDAGYQQNTGTFIEYDENNEIISSTSFYGKAGLNFGGTSALRYRQIRLNANCRRIFIKPNLGLTKYSIAQLIERGNRIYINHNRQMYWGGKRISEIYGIPLPVVSKDLFEGKTICCMGDSITDIGSSSANGSYVWQMQLQHNCAVINYGRGNAHFCDVAGTDPTANTNPGIGKASTPEGYDNVVSTQVRWCIREMQEDNVTPDVFILSGCTNDAFTAPHLGSLEDALAAYPMTEDAVHTDFYPCAVYMVSKIREAFPNAKIYFATPIRSLNTGQMEYLQTYVEAFHTIADALGIEVIDWFKESGIIQYPAGTWSGESTFTHKNPWFNEGDSIHPSQLGVNAMAKLAVSKIISSFAQNM